MSHWNWFNGTWKLWCDCLLIRTESDFTNHANDGGLADFYVYLPWTRRSCKKKKKKRNKKDRLLNSTFYVIEVNFILDRWQKEYRSNDISRRNTFLATFPFHLLFADSLSIPYAPFVKLRGHCSCGFSPIKGSGFSWNDQRVVGNLEFNLWVLWLLAECMKIHKTSQLLFRLILLKILVYFSKKFTGTLAKNDENSNLNQLTSWRNRRLKFSKHPISEFRIEYD